MNINEPCVVNILLYISDTLKSQKSVSFNDVMSAPKCRKYSVSEIGKALEFLRRNGFVKASSCFGCSELFEFNATGITELGKEHIKKIR